MKEMTDCLFLPCFDSEAILIIDGRTNDEREREKERQKQKKKEDEQLYIWKKNWI